MIRAHIIKLDPTYAQVAVFQQCIGTARFAFNWALSQWREQYASGLKPSAAKLSKQLNAIKRDQFPWMWELPKTVVQQAIRNLGDAYENFFKSCTGKRSGRKFLPPVFKSRHKSKKSARIDNGPGTFKFSQKAVTLPKIGDVRLCEPLRFNGKPLSATLKYVGDRWWLVVQVELADTASVTHHGPAVGIDVGIDPALTLSTGEKFLKPNALPNGLSRIRRLNRRIAHQQKGSKNQIKLIKKLARIHWHVAQVRKDWQHKLTSAIAKRFSLVCLESLGITGLMTNHKLARAIGDVGWFTIKTQLRYKCSKTQDVGRFYPSSKTCSSCRAPALSLSLGDKRWTCSVCGRMHDRDVNSALNIFNEGIRLYTASCAGISACEVGGSGVACLGQYETADVEAGTTSGGQREIQQMLESAIDIAIAPSPTGRPASCLISDRVP